MHSIFDHGNLFRKGKKGRKITGQSSDQLNYTWSLKLFDKTCNLIRLLGRWSNRAAVKRSVAKQQQKVYNCYLHYYHLVVDYDERAMYRIVKAGEQQKHKQQTQKKTIKSLLDTFIKLHRPTNIRYNYNNHHHHHQRDNTLLTCWLAGWAGKTDWLLVLCCLIKLRRKNNNNEQQFFVFLEFILETSSFYIQHNTTFLPAPRFIEYLFLKF